jgi:biopolymer transport protein TolR
MGRKTDLLQNQIISEINLTPLMDLTFILLITFIITFPLLESGLPVSLPKASGNPIENPDTISITVDAGGRWYVDNVAMEEDVFAAEMKYLQTSRADALYLLRGDEGLPYGDLIKVMQVMKAAGIQKISLVTQTGGALPGS